MQMKLPLLQMMAYFNIYNMYIWKVCLDTPFFVPKIKSCPNMTKNEIKKRVNFTNILKYRYL